MARSRAIERSFTNFKEKIRIFIDKDIDTIRDLLMNVIEGKEVDLVYNHKAGKIIKTAPPTQTRIQACKVYNELILEKVLPKQKWTSGDEVELDYGTELSAIAKEIEAEKKAELERKAKEEGKLADKKVGSDLEY